jgi:hypothetical protein
MLLTFENDFFGVRRPPVAPVSVRREGKRETERETERESEIGRARDREREGERDLSISSWARKSASPQEMPSCAPALVRRRGRGRDVAASELISSAKVIHERRFMHPKPHPGSGDRRGHD